MKKYFKKSVMAAAIALVSSLCIHGVGMAETMEVDYPFVHFYYGENFAKVPLWKGELSETPHGYYAAGRYTPEELEELLKHYWTPIVRNSNPPPFDGGSARAPVWTDELGLVDLDQYTTEELVQMVLDYWTPERLRNIVPLAEWPGGGVRDEWLTEDARRAIADAPPAVSFPAELWADPSWTPDLLRQ